MTGGPRHAVKNLKYSLFSSASTRELWPKYTSALALAMSSSSCGVRMLLTSSIRAASPSRWTFGRACLAASASSFAMALATPFD